MAPVMDGRKGKNRQKHVFFPTPAIFYMHTVCGHKIRINASTSIEYDCRGGGARGTRRQWTFGKIYIGIGQIYRDGREPNADAWKPFSVRHTFFVAVR